MCFSIKTRRAAANLFVAAAVALVAASCSKSERYTGTAPVSGKVTYNGQPVEGAAITFISEGAETPDAAMTAQDGGYTVHVKAGKYTVLVSKTNAPSTTEPVSMEQAALENDKPAVQATELLPAKYNSVSDSPLKAEVKQNGQNTFDASLSD